MHGPSLSTLVVAASLGFFSAPTLAGTPEALEAARKKLAQQDGIAAVAILEDALPEAGAGKDLILGLLQQGYESAASQAQKAGRTREAETYRENLKILKRKSRQAQPPATNPLDAPAPALEKPTGLPANQALNIDPGPTAPIPVQAEPTSPIESSTEPKPLPDQPPVPPSRSNEFEVPKQPELEPLPQVPSERPAEPSTAPLLQIPAQAPALDHATADAAFEAKNYKEAGRVYAALDREKRLPADRRDHWLYCRADQVAARINAKPKNAEEWSSINEEIARMRALNPSFYLSEYLRNLATEIQTAQKKTKPSNKLVVRGSAPEEPARVDRPVRPASNNGPAEPPRPIPAVASSNGSASRIGTRDGRWQILDSKNFRIYHAEPELAARVSKAAETARAELVKRWPTANPRGDWSPPCEIYLYPSARQYAQMTGQPEDSPGFSTMGMNAGRISNRRINLRTDHPTTITAVLPHEITHVILADFFTEKQIPRWADEGLAVLSEPQDEQERRAADLTTPLAVDKLFRIEDLLNMDYPDQQYWNLYYAQSVSVSRFLTEQGTSTQILQFLQAAQREGYEPALRRIYQIEGYADLQDRWLAYAKAKVDRRTADAAPPAPTAPEVKVR